MHLRLQELQDMLRIQQHIKVIACFKMQEIKERIEDLEKELETDVDVVAEIENQYTYAKSTWTY